MFDLGKKISNDDQKINFRKTDTFASFFYQPQIIRITQMSITSANETCIVC